MESFLQKGNCVEIYSCCRSWTEAETFRFRALLGNMAAEDQDEVVLDFCQSGILSSEIISIAFLAVQALAPYDVRLAIRAPMSRRRTLIATGLSQYAELSLSS